MFIFFT
jgi:hypothetical protein